MSTLTSVCKMKLFRSFYKGIVFWSLNVHITITSPSASKAICRNATVSPCRSVRSTVQRFWCYLWACTYRKVMCSWPARRIYFDDLWSESLWSDSDKAHFLWPHLKTLLTNLIKLRNKGERPQGIVDGAGPRDKNDKIERIMCKRNSPPF